MRTGNNQPWQKDQIQAAGDVESQPPSHGDLGHLQGNSNNQFEETNTFRGLDQTGVIGDDTKPPSFTELNHGQGDSYNQDPSKNRGSGGGSYVSDTGGRPLSASDILRNRVSDTSGGVGSYQEGKAPSRGDMGLRGTSDNGSSGIVFDGPDAQEFAGISLVGKNFRKFYPNAYYKEEDDEK